MKPVYKKRELHFWVPDILRALSSFHSSETTSSISLKKFNQFMNFSSVKGLSLSLLSLSELLRSHKISLSGNVNMANVLPQC